MYRYLVPVRTWWFYRQYVPPCSRHTFLFLDRERRKRKIAPASNRIVKDKSAIRHPTHVEGLLWILRTILSSWLNTSRDSSICWVCHTPTKRKKFVIECPSHDTCSYVKVLPIITNPFFTTATLNEPSDLLSPSSHSRFRRKTLTRAQLRVWHVLLNFWVGWLSEREVHQDNPLFLLCVP